jgi:uncharacterized protein with ParB-like and HNH nuclease domain
MATKFNPVQSSFDELSRQITRGDKRFNIPGFQREYRWKNNDDKGCGPFVSDIFNLLDHDEPHFFNSLIYIESATEGSDDAVFDIIDGQQRITSFILLNAAMSTLFDSFKFVIEENTLKSRKEQEKYPPRTGSKLVSINDIFVKPERLGYKSLIPTKTVHQLFSDSFVYIKE